MSHICSFPNVSGNLGFHRSVSMTLSIATERCVTDATVVLTRDPRRLPEKSHPLQQEFLM